MEKQQIIDIIQEIAKAEGLSVNAESLYKEAEEAGKAEIIEEQCEQYRHPIKTVVGATDVLSHRGVEAGLNDLKRRTEIMDAHPYRFDYKDSIQIIESAIEKGEKITVCGDYDVDGVMASAIMKTALEAAGAKEVTIRIPLRFEEGFGLNPSIIDEIESGLIVTVDNGIAAHEAIDKAKEKGLTVVVTDHHEPVVTDGKIDLPKADCIIDPNADKYLEQTGYDFDAYCGAGIALKISEGLLGKQHPLMNPLCAMAAVATVADVMPLVEANKNIVKHGIDVMARGKGPLGLQQLFIANKINPMDVPAGLPASMYITGDIIGYKIAPCINADSRINGNANTAIACMLSKDVSEAQTLARHLVEANEKRRELTAKEDADVRKYIAAEKIMDAVGLPASVCPIVVYLPESGPGIIGLHAGRICEEERVPCIVINGTGDECKGSARAPDGVNMKEMLDACSSYMEKYGGHAGAAGLTVKESRIPAFKQALKDYCIEHEIRPMNTKSVYYDLTLDAREVPEALQVMQKLAPFGEGNPEPVFKIDNFEVESVRVLGQKGTLKLEGPYGDAIGFGMANGMTLDDANAAYPTGSMHTLVGRASYNCFRGAMTPQIVFDHIDTAEERSKDEMDLDVVGRSDEGTEIEVGIEER